MRKQILIVIMLILIAPPLIAGWKDELTGFELGQTPEQIYEIETREFCNDQQDYDNKNLYWITFDVVNGSDVVHYGFVKQRLVCKYKNIYFNYKKITNTEQKDVLDMFNTMANDLDEIYGKRKQINWKGLYRKAYYWKDKEKYITINIRKSNPDEKGIEHFQINLQISNKAAGYLDL